MPASHITHTLKVGEPAERLDGCLKVTGQAQYAGEQPFDQPALIGAYVGARCGPATLTHLDTQAAEQAPGVHAVLTYRNAPEQQDFAEPADAARFGQSRAVLHNTHIRYAGFPVALVVAETLAQARYAASLVDYTLDHEGFDELTERDQADTTPESLDGGFSADAHCGLPAEDDAASQIDSEYATPNQVSAAMEPHATLAWYDGKTLHVRTSVQIIASAVTCLANTLKLPAENIHVQSPFIGGGFGSKLGLHNDAILACLGTLHLGRPVQVTLHRRQVFHSAPHRGFSWQQIRLAADNQGHLQHIQHVSQMPMARDYAFAEATGAGARITYQAPAISSRHRVKVIDSPVIDSVRAPGDAIGSLAFESAIDELALAAGQDPVAFRLANIATAHPITGKPFSSHYLADCLRQGAEEFNWQQRQYPEHDEFSTGYGVALAMRMNTLVESEARLELSADGVISVFTDMTDIGTGTYTILSQVVSEYFDLPAHRIQIELADSRYPASSGSGGSFGASSSAGAVHNACEQLGRLLCQKAGVAAATRQLRIDEDELVLGQAGKQQRHTLSTLMGQTLAASGSVAPGQGHEQFEQYSCGAHFAKVRVSRVTGEVRVERQHGVFSAGQILNRQTATSQLQGGMIWGTSYALFEDLQRDPRSGGFINCDLAEYHIAVNRDIGALSVSFIEQPDYHASPLGSKGIGELGITGSGAAIANAVYDAVGVRVKAFPLTPDKVMAGLK